MHSPSLKQWVAKGLSLNTSENADKAKSVEVEGSNTPASDARPVQDGSIAPEAQPDGPHFSVLNVFGKAENIEQAGTEAAKMETSPSTSKANDGVVDALVHAITNRAITCSHGKLDPGETQSIRVISAVRLRRSEPIVALAHFRRYR